MDQTPFRKKYKVTRLDGKPVGTALVIELDKDPSAVKALLSLAAVYLDDRPAFAKSLMNMAIEKDAADSEAEYKSAH